MKGEKEINQHIVFLFHSGVFFDDFCWRIPALVMKNESFSQNKFVENP
jgi:hypothetical protein